MEHYIGFQIVVLMIYIIIGGAIIMQIKNVDGFYKFAIYIILLNLILTILTPNMSIFNLLAYDDIKFNIKDNWSIRGQIGDLLSGHFTALAFIGLMLTISQMNKALKQQDEAILIQKQEMNKQFKEMYKQSFENKFFQMLNLFTKNIETLTVKIDGKQYKGNEIFEPLKKDFEKKIQHRISMDQYEKIKTSKFNHFINEFIQFNNHYDTSFKYYFLNLFQLLNYIDTDIPNKDDAKKYTNILRAQLSKNELILLAYNAIGVQSFTTNKYQELVEKYEFFEHLTYDDFHTNSYIIEVIDSILKKYKNDAFGNNTKIIKLIGSTR